MLFRSDGGGCEFDVQTSKITPGDRGKIGAGWLARSLSAADFGSCAEAGFTGSSSRVRARLVQRETGAARLGTMRNRSEPDQVTTAGFERLVNRSHSKECAVATVCQHGAKALAARQIF